MSLPLEHSDGEEGERREEEEERRNEELRRQARRLNRITLNLFPLPHRAERSRTATPRLTEKTLLLLKHFCLKNCVSVLKRNLPKNLHQHKTTSGRKGFYKIKITPFLLTFSHLSISHLAVINNMPNSHFTFHYQHIYLSLTNDDIRTKENNKQ